MPLDLHDVLRLGVAALSVLVFTVGFVAYLRRPTTRMLLVVVLFAAFLAQGALLLAEVLWTQAPLVQDAYYAFQLVEIALVTLIILKG